MTTYRIPVFFEVECDNAEAAREILAGLLSEGFIDSDPNLIIDAIAIANVDEIETLEHANV